MSFRDIKAKARMDLHLRMRVPAFYFAPGTMTDPVAVNVRVHNKFDALKPVGIAYPLVTTREDDSPQVVFWLEEQKPANNGIVIISDSEGYRLDTLEPEYLQTQTGKASKMRPADIAQYDTGV